MKIKLGKLLAVLEQIVGAAPTIVKAIKPIVAAAGNDRTSDSATVVVSKGENT